MTRARVAAALAVLWLAGCTASGAGAPSPAGSPSELPSPSVAWTTFVSDRYGYAIEHPVDWSVREVGGNPLRVGQRLGSPGTDLIGPDDSFRYGSDDGMVAIFAKDPEPGETLEDFTLRHSRASACREAGARRDPTRLDGEPAEVRSFSCGAHRWLQLTAFHDGRAYVVWLVATAPPGPANRPANDQLLASFRFTD